MFTLQGNGLKLSYNYRALGWGSFCCKLIVVALLLCSIVSLKCISVCQVDILYENISIELQSCIMCVKCGGMCVCALLRVSE